MVSHQSCIGIIPARGGSKGIPGKNLQFLVGKPLIAWTIEAAKKAGTVDRVIVSTDDREIGATAKRYAAEVIWRPRELSHDTASSEQALLHVLEHVEKLDGYRPDITVFLQCTSPMTLPEDIDGTVGTLLGEKADSALAAAPFHYFLWKRDESGNAIGINHDRRIRPLRQEREEQFIETGAVYAMRTKGFKKARHRFFGKTAVYVMPKERCLEIDEPIDLVMAETLLRRLIS